MVNFNESWDVEYEMNLKDDDGLHEDPISDIWYAKEDRYGVVEFITIVFNSARLEEDESYTWIDFITKEYF